MGRPRKDRPVEENSVETTQFEDVVFTAKAVSIFKNDKNQWCTAVIDFDPKTESFGDIKIEPSESRAHAIDQFKILAVKNGLVSG